MRSLHPEYPELLPVDGGHHQCSDCDRVIYSDPKVAVAAIISMDGGIVLLKRAIEPGFGMWSFPSGYVDRGEQLETALAREVMEECGLVVEVKWLVGVYSGNGSSVVLVVYHAEPKSGTLVAGDETSDAQVFALDAMPPLAFEHDNRIIQAWQASKGMRG